MTLTVRALPRAKAQMRFDDLARLRIAVFREWPYLYDGDLAYERNYLETYFEAPGAFIAAAFDENDMMVGACTASPLAQHDDAFSQPFRQAGLDPRRYFYFGESVLRPQFRGQGVGVRFFELREAEARRQGFDTCVFSAVIRPNDHPQRPHDYVPLDAFWRNRGYVPIDGLTTRFPWKDVGGAEETEKPMAYWSRALT
ncbi:MAG: GNAT family N-acetyltransferase [Pseudomonadota bacterium]